jgi:hypothetical protein
LKKATQQRILKALNQLLMDLYTLLQARGYSEAEAVATLNAVMRENGIMAGVVRDLRRSMIPISGDVSGLEKVEDVFASIRSGEYAGWLLNHPEPSPEELKLLLSVYRNALANLRTHFEEAAKSGPRHRGGERPTKIKDPKIRAEIRQAIKVLRKPGIKLTDIYKRFADRYDVSPSTIKRIRLEKIG